MRTLKPERTLLRERDEANSERDSLRAQLKELKAVFAEVNEELEDHYDGAYDSGMEWMASLMHRISSL